MLQPFGSRILTSPFASRQPGKAPPPKPTLHYVLCMRRYEETGGVDQEEMGPGRTGPTHPITEGGLMTTWRPVQLQTADHKQRGDKQNGQFYPEKTNRLWSTTPTSKCPAEGKQTASAVVMKTEDQR